ncbi:unnamed protein product, partial [marine sediment metagenome]
MDKRKIYGTELTLDLYGCNQKTIRSRKKLSEFVNNLCALIKMKKYGKPSLCAKEFFGEICRLLYIELLA